MDVGDSRRPLIGRAAFGSVLASGVFFAFTLTKQIKPVYLHAPWENDPYDTVFSFTMFFVPLVAACVLVRVSLCRKSQPLLTSRAAAILRGCRVAVGAIAVELLSAWAALAVGANRPQWTGVATGVLVALLLIATVVTGKVLTALGRAPRLHALSESAVMPEPDWLADLVAVGERESRWLGPLRGPGLALLAWTDRSLVVNVRRHPLVCAAIASAAFGVSVFGYQGLRERYILSVTLLAMGLGFCGMFAFLVLAGSYLRIVRSPNRLFGIRRRALDAAVAACIAAISALALRGSLWWLIGSSESGAGPAQFARLVTAAIVVVFLLGLAIETAMCSHSKPVTGV
jgi:hypothetical protein